MRYYYLLFARDRFQNSFFIYELITAKLVVDFGKSSENFQIFQIWFFIRVRHQIKLERNKNFNHQQIT